MKYFKCFKCNEDLGAAYDSKTLCFNCAKNHRQNKDLSIFNKKRKVGVSGIGRKLEKEKVKK